MKYMTPSVDFADLFFANRGTHLLQTGNLTKKKTIVMIFLKQK